ncbi:MAG TPA: cellulose biosynthesis protein BcsS [Gemmatimonadaceae bacterium]|nr:cellulose biosynthesis protein BcsS [Gemmatimonadaceae bacterium]
MPARAQKWSTTAYGVAEYGTDEVVLALAGFTTGPSGLGVHPRLGAQAYWLTFNPTNRTNVFVVKPYVGLADVFHGGSIGGNIGYAFANKDIAIPVSSAESGEGVVASGDLEYWGPDAHSLAYQALGSYNFGSSSLWTRGRITAPLRVGMNGAATRLGAEVAFLNGDNYTAWQPGGVLEFHNSKGQILGLGAGAKLIKDGNTEAYFKIEGVAPIGR